VSTLDTLRLFTNILNEANFSGRTFDNVSVFTASEGDTPPDDTPPGDTPPDDTPPAAAAGPNQDLAIGESVDLDGNGSTDADGDDLTYRWTLTTVPSGSDASLDDPTTPTPSFVADLAGTYVANLVVNDGTTDSPPDTVTITAAGGQATSPLLSDTFDRANSLEVGEGWVEVEQSGGAVEIANNRLFFSSTSDLADRPLVRRSFDPVSSGTLRWDFDFDWDRTGNENTYRLIMQLGASSNMSGASQNAGVGVNLIWTSIDGVHQSLGYSQGGIDTALDVLSGLAHISVVADRDSQTYSVAVDGGVVQSGVPFDANVPLDTVRFLTDGVNEQHFAGRAFDNVVVRR
jgi:hypothetical protein